MEWKVFSRGRRLELSLGGRKIPEGRRGRNSGRDWVERLPQDCFCSYRPFRPNPLKPKFFQVVGEIHVISTCCKNLMQFRGTHFHLWIVQDSPSHCCHPPSFSSFQPILKRWEPLSNSFVTTANLWFNSIQWNRSSQNITYCAFSDHFFSAWVYSCSHHLASPFIFYLRCILL